MQLRNIVQVAILIGLASITLACTTAESSQKRQTVEEIYAEALSMYDDGDWNGAVAKFDVIKLQYPASQFADDAQYQLAEINFRRSEFIVAAFNYSMVRRSYPTSELAKPSMYKAALCYNEMSGPPDRDQEYTKKAIQAFSEFQSVYPTDSLSMVCLERIHELRSKLAERYMIIADHYLTTRTRKSAVIYYDAVITEFPDTEWYEEAVVGKLRTLVAMTLIEEAQQTIALYRRTVREPKFLRDVEDLEKELP